MKRINRSHQGIISVVALLLMTTLGLWNQTQATNAEAFTIKLASYTFEVTLDGDTTSANSRDFKGIPLKSSQARTLQSEGELALPITVSGASDSSINLSYIVLFDPFYRNSIFGAADTHFSPVESSTGCRVEEFQGQPQASEFYVERQLESTDHDNLTQHHYCFTATAPADPQRSKIFQDSDPNSEPEVWLNIRLQAA